MAKKKREFVDPKRVGEMLQSLTDGKKVEFFPPQKPIEHTAAQMAEDPYREHFAIGDEKLNGPYT